MVPRALDHRLRALGGALGRRQVEQVLEHLVHHRAAHRVGRRLLGQPVDGAEAVEQRAGAEVARAARRERPQDVHAVDGRPDAAAPGPARSGPGALERGLLHGHTVGRRSDRAGAALALGRERTRERRTAGAGGRRTLPARCASARSRGVDVLVRSSWLLVALLIAVLLAPRVEQVQPGLGALKYVAGVAFAVLLYLSVLLHEISHALMAQRYGLGVRSISLHFLGGATEIDSETRTPGQEFKVAVVGPLTSIAVGLAGAGRCCPSPPTACCGWPSRGSPAPTSSSACSTWCPGCRSTAAGCCAPWSGRSPATCTAAPSSPPGAAGSPPSWCCCGRWLARCCSAPAPTSSTT